MSAVTRLAWFWTAICVTCVSVWIVLCLLNSLLGKAADSDMAVAANWSFYMGCVFLLTGVLPTQGAWHLERKNTAALLLFISLILVVGLLFQYHIGEEIAFKSAHWVFLQLEDSLVSVSASNGVPLDAAPSGSLLHIQADAASITSNPSTYHDPELGVTVLGAIHVQRRREYCQILETEDNGQGLGLTNKFNGRGDDAVWIFLVFLAIDILTYLLSSSNPTYSNGQFLFDFI